MKLEQLIEYLQMDDLAVEERIPTDSFMGILGFKPVVYSRYTLQLESLIVL